MQLLKRMPRHLRALYLTFDDGPDPEETPRLLDMLGRLEARATFFLLGREAERYPELVRMIVEAGHALGNHSMTHPWFDRISWREQLDEIRQSDAVLKKFDGNDVHPFRPPHGRGTVFAMATCMIRRQKLVLWSHDSRDYCESAGQVLSSLQSKAMRNGDILLFHDDGPVARQALSRLLPVWKSAGFQFPTIS
jgi:peptidoglycan/xylan/chitin deacetylase (PgdA/CDA1 family)